MSESMISTSDRPLNVQVVAGHFQKVDRAIREWKDGIIEGVIITRTKSGAIGIKRLPKVIED